MKIGINAVVLGPEDTGVGIWTRGLIRALAGIDRENQYLIYLRRGTNPFGSHEVPSNFHLFHIPGPRRGRIPRITWEQLVLPRLSRAHRLDLLHCPAYVAPHHLGVPTVLTLHDLLVYTHPRCCRLMNRIHFRLRLPDSVWQSTRIHCTSHWTRRILCSRFPLVRYRARVVHPAVDDIFRPYTPSEVERYRESRRFPVDPFLFVGNPEPKKNIDVLLHAYTLLKHQHGCRRKLIIVGGGG